MIYKEKNMCFFLLLFNHCLESRLTGIIKYVSVKVHRSPVAFIISVTVDADCPVAIGDDTVPRPQVRSCSLWHNNSWRLLGAAHLSNMVHLRIYQETEIRITSFNVGLCSTTVQIIWFCSCGEWRQKISNNRKHTLCSVLTHNAIFSIMIHIRGVTSLEHFPSEHFLH